MSPSNNDKVWIQQRYQALQHSVSNVMTLMWTICFSSWEKGSVWRHNEELISGYCGPVCSSNVHGICIKSTTGSLQPRWRWYIWNLDLSSGQSWKTRYIKLFTLQLVLLINMKGRNSILGYFSTLCSLSSSWLAEGLGLNQTALPMLQNRRINVNRCRLISLPWVATFTDTEGRSQQDSVVRQSLLH